MMAEARQLPRSLRDQLGQHRWDTVPTRAASFLLEGKKVLLVGYGSIASRLAEMLVPFRMELVGFRRTPRGDEAIEVHPVDKLLAWLPQADFVVNLLPAHSDTVEFFDTIKFAAMKAGAVFINMGRGATVEQSALLAALRGDLGAAYLDVTSPEPLPPEHPLWTQRNCYLTPHVGGGHGDEYDRLVKHFLANFQRFLHGQSLSGRVY
jgi:phosphoglycerate dehydrogenase-like enzyme